MTTVQRAQHAVTSLFYPGSSTEPWQRCHMCTCGIELAFDEQGMSSADVDGAFADHMRDEARYADWMRDRPVTPYCHQEVVDSGGHLDACNEPATTTRADPEDGHEYPVCHMHRTRSPEGA